MNDTTQSIVESLDGEDSGLLPFLPYLLQDLWEIGASPPHLIELLKRNNLVSHIDRVLDLGCGKGAVSINMAKEYGWRVHGIDAMPEFIAEAQERSVKHNTGDLCHFEVDDIRTAINSLNGYDLVVLGSIGPVLGPIKETLITLKPCLNTPGFVLFDDGYLLENDSSSPHDYPNREQALQQIDAAGYDIIDELIYPSDVMAESNQDIFDAIQQRAVELEKKAPDQQQLLRDYLAAQKIENNALENELVCVTWLLKPKVNLKTVDLL